MDTKTIEDLRVQEEQTKLENEDKKADQLRLMAWVAMFSMLITMLFLFTPVLSTERIDALDNLITMFFISQAGIVATFFGSSAYMTVNKT